MVIENLAILKLMSTTTHDARCRVVVGILLDTMETCLVHMVNGVRIIVIGDLYVSGLRSKLGKGHFDRRHFRVDVIRNTKVNSMYGSA